MSAIPQQIGKYVVSGVIGRGGMGVVYRGTDPMLQRPVAIKVLHDPSLAEGEMQQRFLQEARAAANLRHENIVTIYEVDQQDGFTYVAMEFVSGETLDAVVRRGKSLPVRDVLGWIDQLCAGLALAHSRGIVHRDIKPANLVVDEHGALRILDFGIARVEGSTMTAAGDMLGTLHYMSPEQVHGRPIDYRSDIFAVGATAYELATGQQAFAGNAAAAIHRILNTEPSPPSSIRSDLPAELDGIIARALSKDPARRFGDLREMRRQIHALQARLDTAETIVSKPVTTSAATEPTLVVKRPVWPTPSHETQAVPPTPAPDSIPEPLTRLEPSAPSETIVARRVRWSPLMIAVALLVVAAIGGVASGTVWPAMFERTPSRPANDLAALIESSIAPYFDEEARRYIEGLYGEDWIEAGLRVETTLDVDLQREGNFVVRNAVVGLDGIEAALVAIDNRTGGIRAMVGGATPSQYNRANRLRRVGSLFMPVVFTAAIDRGYTPISIINDEPTTISTGARTSYSISNDDGTYMGPITLRQALEQSRHSAAMNLMWALGPSVRGYARRLGLGAGDDAQELHVTLANDGPEATLVEMTVAYATIANKGVGLVPRTIESVIGRDGTVLTHPVSPPAEGIRADTAFMITYLLTGVIERGAGAPARTLGWTLAGKSGGTSDNNDAWFVGFDPDMTIGVWVGYDDTRSAGASRVRSVAVEVWTEFMRRYIATRTDTSNPPGFVTPDNIVFSSVGGEAVPFLKGTEPSGQPGADSR